MSRMPNRRTSNPMTDNPFCYRRTDAEIRRSKKPCRNRVCVPLFQREKAAYVYLRRRFHYSISVLSQAFGRSTSVIHRILKFNVAIGAIPRFSNKENCGNRIRTLSLVRQQNDIYRIVKAWEAWILGEGEKPP